MRVRDEEERGMVEDEGEVVEGSGWEGRKEVWPKSNLRKSDE